MSSRKIDTWIWGLIYGGMALGALLVVVRSRIGDKP